MNEGSVSPDRSAARWIGGGLLAVAMSLVAVRWLWGCFLWREMLAGWFVALLNAWGTDLVNRASVGPTGRRFPLKGLFLNVVRVFILVGMVVVALGWLGKDGFYPFLVALFSGYFLFLVSEIVRLHRSIVERPSTHE